MHITDVSVAIFAFISVTLGHPIAEDSLLLRANALNFQGCSTVQQSLLMADLQDMQTLASAAAKNANSGNKYFAALFGKQPSNGVPDVNIQTRFQLLSTATTQAWHADQAPTLRCDSNNAPDRRCNTGWGAPAMTQNAGGSFPTIWICQNYWKGRRRIKDIALPNPTATEPLDEYIPTGGLLLHEYTHAWFSTTDTKLRQGSESGNVAYGQERALRLVQENNGPYRARNNADSYRIFAAAVTLRGRWSTNPDRLQTGRPDF